MIQRFSLYHLYDWTNAKYNAGDTSNVSLNNQQYLIRTFYALGIWGDKTVQSFGALKNKEVEHESS